MNTHTPITGSLTVMFLFSNIPAIVASIFTIVWTVAADPVIEAVFCIVALLRASINSGIAFTSKLYITKYRNADIKNISSGRLIVFHY